MNFEEFAKLSQTLMPKTRSSKVNSCKLVNQVTHLLIQNPAWRKLILHHLSLMDHHLVLLCHNSAEIKKLRVFLSQLWKNNKAIKLMIVFRLHRNILTTNTTITIMNIVITTITQEIRTNTTIIIPQQTQIHSIH